MGVFFYDQSLILENRVTRAIYKAQVFFSLNFRLKFSTLYHIDIIKRETWTYLITFLKSYDVGLYCIR